MDDEGPRRRMPRHERRAQLLAVARELIHDAGTDEFTLGRLAERAGVTKPIVYDHFGDRAGALAELYRAFEEQQRASLTAALAGADPTLGSVCAAVAGAYIDCSLAEGRELADVVSALAGSATLAEVRREAEEAYLALCREALATCGGRFDHAAARAVVGAGDSLSRAVLEHRISAGSARSALSRVLHALAHPSDDRPEAS
ncbi:TetR/AcrR family transcriptional regulator [Microbacterium sp. cf332]|uniref:TetR/AcrR family transcriptional regulator n=1 Tax=Microbacterium sp. cf332 TaxID=1761804 RepID=UPI000886EB0E|nr:TetR/AcrR family transcriptional regulator [Microbacterium sp. cf332]SDQ82253.1 transcriptional regulator, TetR family [Microbacterium sp. cf332]